MFAREVLEQVTAGKPGCARHEDHLWHVRQPRWPY
jgi:hypothetical protein